MIQASDYPIKDGGLFRCCIETIMKWGFEVAPEEGHKIQCEHCQAHIVLYKGFWQGAPDDNLSSVPATP